MHYILTSILTLPNLKVFHINSIHLTSIPDQFSPIPDQFQPILIPIPTNSNSSQFQFQFQPIPVNSNFNSNQFQSISISIPTNSKPRIGIGIGQNWNWCIPRSSHIYSIIPIKHLIIVLIVEYHLWPILNKCSLHQSSRVRRCFDVILGFLGAMYETMLYCQTIRPIIKVLIERFIVVLAYRAKSDKEVAPSRICSNSMSCIRRFF